VSGNGTVSKKLCSCGRETPYRHPPFVKWLLLSRFHEPREVCDACATEAPVTTHMRPINRRPDLVGSGFGGPAKRRAVG
jgi:hypothetical protein